MSGFRWDESLETGDDVVDAHHRELFTIANELRSAISEGRGREQALATARRLQRYAAEHFSAEDALMAAIDYPHREAHCAQHRELADRVEELASRYESGEAKTALPLANFVLEWLGEHIRRSDSDLVTYALEGVGAR